MSFKAHLLDSPHTYSRTLWKFHHMFVHIAWLAGWLGMIMFLLAYALVSSKKLDSSGVWYNGLQVVGAIAVAISLIPAQAWSTILLEVFFVGIGSNAIRKAAF